MKKRQGGDTELLVFYSFNGNMEHDELVRQLRELAAQGVTGFFVHARAGLEIAYMQEEWFACFQLCVDTAEELGMSVYIYDENGWPSGFCGGAIPALGEAYQYKYLAFSRGVPPGEAGHRVIAAYACEEGGCRRISDGEITDSSLVAYYGVDENYVDLLCRDTVKEFIARTHEVYKERFGRYFGSVIKGVFTDEPQMRCDHITWSFSAPAYYRETYGEDLLDELWKLSTAYFDEAFSDRYIRMLNHLVLPELQRADWRVVCGKRPGFYRTLWCGRWPAVPDPLQRRRDAALSGRADSGHRPSRCRLGFAGADETGVQRGGDAGQTSENQRGFRLCRMGCALCRAGLDLGLACGVRHQSAVPASVCLFDQRPPQTRLSGFLFLSGAVVGGFPLFRRMDVAGECVYQSWKKTAPGAGAFRC